MEKFRGKLKFRFLFMTFFSMFVPTFIFIFMIHYIITKRYNEESILIAHMFGAICIPPMIMLMRFYKLIYVNSEFISIYYPFLFFLNKKIKIKDITNESTFSYSFFRHPFTRKAYDHQFAFYKTSKDQYILISDFNFKNYVRIVSHIDQRTENIGHIDFIRPKHQIMLLIFVFTIIFSVAITAT